MKVNVLVRLCLLFTNKFSKESGAEDKMKENNILSFNFRVPSALRDEVLEYFNRFQMGEPTAVDIGGTGDIKCIFKGISPVLREENASKDYYALSVLLQETGKTVPSEEELCETCSHCGFH